MTDKTFAMGPHDNCITVEFVRLFQNLLGWKTFTYFYRLHYSGIFCITIEFFVANPLQPLPDSIDGVGDVFNNSLFTCVIIKVKIQNRLFGRRPKLKDMQDDDTGIVL